MKTEETQMCDFHTVVTERDSVVVTLYTYWVLALSPSSGILETRKHDVSETGSINVLR
jgi:hypothetical protein